MLTAEKKKKYTVDDYLLLEEGSPFQLINNDLIMSPSPLLIHQLILGDIYEIFKAFLKEQKNNGFLILSPMDVQFNEDNIYQPDLSFISAERVDDLAKERIYGPPDLIIEILSPSNAYYDLRQKKDIYEKYGVKEYIIIDPIQENADLYALKDGTYHLHQKADKTETLQSLLLTGFDLELKNIFR